MTTTPIADMVDGMVAAGAGSAAIAVAVRAVEQSVTRHAPSRDASRTVTVLSMNPGAIRARRSRENRKQIQALAEANDAASAGDQSVTVERDASRDGVTAHCDLSSFLSSSDSQETTEKVKKKKGSKQVEGRARGTRLALDWQPDEADRQFARDHNVDPDQLRPEFVDFWTAVPGQRGTKLDWSATWRNRVRQIQTYRKEKNGQGRPRTVQQAAQDQLDKFRSINAPAPALELELQPGIRDGTRPADVRLLPPGGRERS